MRKRRRRAWRGRRPGGWIRVHRCRPPHPLRECLYDFVAVALDKAAGDDELAGGAGGLEAGHLQDGVNRFPLAVSIKLQVFTTRISASSGWAVRRAPARSSRPIITSESTRFLGQPKEINPTEGATGEEVLVTLLLYRGWNPGACDKGQPFARPQQSDRRNPGNEALFHLFRVGIPNPR